MKVIETLYHGHLFRSRLEARYAVFLNTLGEQWLYEDQGFDLDGDKYLPDFWLPVRQTFLEVKGKYPNKREIRVARKLQFFTGHDVLICYGLPQENEYILFSQSDEDGGTLTETFVDWPWPVEGRIQIAGLAAKQARFEYGQTPEIAASRSYPNIVNYEDIAF